MSFIQDRHHEYRSVKILKRVLENKKEYPDITPAEIDVIGNMITFSEKYKVFIQLHVHHTLVTILVLTELMKLS